MYLAAVVLLLLVIPAACVLVEAFALASPAPLMDLVGKVYGVPCYQLLGGKFRDKVRVYGDTPTPADPTPEAFADVVRSRRELGLDFIKFDLSARMFETVPGAMVGSDTRYEYPQYRQFHTPGRGAGARISERGLELVRDICGAVRDQVGAALAETGSAAIEYKLDGARIQVHKAGDDVRVFSRALNDVTTAVPEVVEAARQMRGTSTCQVDDAEIALVAGGPVAAPVSSLLLHR